MACRTWHLHYACGLDTASSLITVLCLSGSKNNFMMRLKERDLWHDARGSVLRGRSRRTRRRVHAQICHIKNTLFFFLLVASFGWQRRRQSGLLGHVPIRLYPVNHVAAFTVLHIHYMCLAPWAAVRIESSPVSLTFAEGLSPPGALSRRRTRVTFQHFLCALFRFDFLE